MTSTEPKLFAKTAPSYWRAGYTVIPVTPGTRASAVSYNGRVNNLPVETQRAGLTAQYPDHCIGLLLGQSCAEGCRTAAVDVDDDRLVRFMREVIGAAPTKFGSKGETLFVRVADDQRGFQIRNAALSDKPLVELLSTGQQTVLPPSPHWKTGKPYRWTSERTLPDTPAAQWPLLEEWKQQLLRRVLEWKRLPEVLCGTGTNIPMRDLVWHSLAWFGPDPDQPDSALAERALTALLPEGYQGNTDEELKGERGLIGRALRKGDYPQPGSKTRSVSLAARLLEQVNNSGAELFHDGAGGTFVSVACEQGGWETFSTDAQATRDWLMRLALRMGTAVVSRKALDEISGALRARALFEGRQQEVFVRVGKSERFPLVIDLGGRGDGRAVVVTPDGFRVEAEHGVRFLRSAGMLSLPEPNPSGDLSPLQHLLALERDDWAKFLAFTLVALRPKGPFMGLAVNGVSGSGKSVRSESLKFLLDPNDAMRQSLPDKLNDLAVAARHERVPLFDNVSGMSQAISDLLCMVLTGGGFKDRQLYTNQDQYVMKLSRPLILNGISDYIHQSDLLSRLIPVELSAPEQMIPEDEYWSKLEAARPALLGALYRAAAGALKDLPNTVPVASGNRNADCLRWLTACERHVGLEPGTFARVIDDAQGALDSERVRNDPTFLALEKVLELEAFANLMSTLWSKMDEARPDPTRTPPKQFPADGSKLSKWLKRNKAALGRMGVRFSNEHTEFGALVCVWHDGQDPDAAKAKAKHELATLAKHRELSRPTTVTPLRAKF